MSTVILQTPASHETRAVHHAAMLLENMVVVNSHISELQSERVSVQLKQGAMPVGNVEFVREAMRVAGIKDPDNISYPTSALSYLHRSIKQVHAGSVLGKWFVKPVLTKQFNGFVFDTMSQPESYSEHDKKQFNAFMDMSPDSMVWQSEAVVWQSEWRYYVAFDCITGQARYDDGDEDAPEPDIHVVKKCINALDIDHPYALDFGVLSTGETALVEVNDAFAIGLYGAALSSKSYLQFLRERWRTLSIKSVFA